MPTKQAQRADLLRELAGAFRAGNRSVSAATDPILRDNELTAPLAELIWALDPAIDPPAMKDLAVSLRCDRSNITAMVEKLVQRGLAERHENPTDRRSKAVHLTERGVELRVAIMRQLVETPAFASLSNDDLVALLALLRRLAL